MDKTVPLSDFVTLQRGFDLPKRLRKNGDVPVVASSGVIDTHVEPKVKGPGVVIGRSGSIGGGQYIKGDYWPLNTTLWVKDFKGNDPEFVYYLMRSINFQRFNAGAGVPTLNRNHLVAIKIPSYSISQQKGIASILSEYDELIQNNKRRIELLEKSARLLYKEWFVQLRFPGHEHTKIVDGVPEGWRLGKVGDIAKLLSGYAFKSKNWVEKGNPVIKIKNITSNNSVDTWNCQCIDDRVAEKANKYKLETGDLLIAMTGATIGKVGILPPDDRSIYLNQRVGKLESKTKFDITPFLLSFFNTKQAQSLITNLARGAAQPNISASKLESIDLLIPSSIILDSYLDFTKRQFKLRLNLVDQVKKLIKARDLLLPKLMNGDIPV